MRLREFSFIFFVFCICTLAVKSDAQELPLAAPASIGMDSKALERIDDVVNADIAAKKLPGAVVIVGHKGKIVYRKAFGNRSLVPIWEPMTVDTIFDVASLTKPIATATSIMMLVELGKLRLNDTVGKFFPDIDDEQARRITIYQLLTHTSGYAPDFDLKVKWIGHSGMVAALRTEKLRNVPGTRFVYSDINFEILGEIVLKVSDKRLEDFVDAWFPVAGMTDSRFINFAPANSVGSAESFPADDLGTSYRARIAPTENIRGQYSYLGSKFEGDEKTGNEILRGRVHDPTAFRMGGVAGHAGLFSTADDLARYCQMLLNGGVAPAPMPKPARSKGEIGPPKGGTPNRILSAQTVAKMTAPYVVSETGETRGLGWDINTSFSSNRGELFPLGSFGHTGFTGTSIWIDPTSQTFVVFMSNRVHPDGKGDVTPLRARVSTIAASAVRDTPIEAYRLAEAEYQSQVTAQIPKFRDQVEAARRTSTGLQASPPATARNGVSIVVPPVGGQVFNSGETCTSGCLQSTTVLNGIDILEKNGFKELEGKRIGLVTNHTGRNLAGKSTIDILYEAKNVKLVSLFAPEHGIRGELDTEKIDDTKDEKTGLPVYSLYKDGMRRPKPEQLKDLDAIVYDIQDIGARFYTYTATLKNVIEEAAKAKIPVYVLDRPNPINGVDVEGPLAQEDKLSFIAAHTIPVRYGLTIGELGQMMNTERKIGAELHVIKMDGWKRSMWFDETGQTWVNPSPNMRSLTEATLYPGIGLLETTNVSVGRGTDTPFEVVGAPWLDGQKLAKYLNERNLKGVRFVPVKFKPNASVFKDEELGGVNLLITDRKVFESVRTGLEIATALRKLYQTEWQIDRYERLLVNADILAMIKAGESPESVEKVFARHVEDFARRRAAFLLYK